jgi:hypothetical protein
MKIRGVSTKLYSFIMQTYKEFILKFVLVHAFLFILKLEICLLQVRVAESLGAVGAIIIGK